MIDTSSQGMALAPHQRKPCQKCQPCLRTTVSYLSGPYTWPAYPRVQSGGGWENVSVARLSSFL